MGIAPYGARVDGNVDVLAIHLDPKIPLKPSTLTILRTTVTDGSNHLTSARQGEHRFNVPVVVLRQAKPKNLQIVILMLRYTQSCT